MIYIWFKQRNCDTKIYVLLHKTVQGSEFRSGKSKRFYWFNLKCRFACLLQRNIFRARPISFTPSRCRSEGDYTPLLRPWLISTSSREWNCLTDVCTCFVCFSIALIFFLLLRSNHFTKLSFGLFFPSLFSFSSHLPLCCYVVSLSSLLLFFYTV